MKKFIILIVSNLTLLIIGLSPFMVSAQTLKFTIDLSGANVHPPNNSPGVPFLIGFATLDITTKIFTTQIYDFGFVTPQVTSTHLHGPVAIPYTSNTGLFFNYNTLEFKTVNSVFQHAASRNLTTNLYPSAYYTANGNTINTVFNAFTIDLLAGKFYLDIHTPIYAGGEARGFLTPKYTFTGNGSWSNAANWDGGSVPPSNLTGRGEIVIDPIVGGECVMNIPTQTIAPGAKFTVKTLKKLRIVGSLIIQ
jgi:CHRD domain